MKKYTQDEIAGRVDAARFVSYPSLVAELSAIVQQVQAELTSLQKTKEELMTLWEVDRTDLKRMRKMNNKLLAEISRAKLEERDRKARLFPLLYPPKLNGTRAIPWGMLEPHEDWALQNHGQTLQQLANRGGLSPLEVLCILDHKGGGEKYVDPNGLLAARVAEYKHVLAQEGKPPAPAIGDGAELILQERIRQVSQEGWSMNRDLSHSQGELAMAAVAYTKATYIDDGSYPPLSWPASWDRKWWKPGNPIRMLVKAGALIAAEIDRRIQDGL